MAAIGLFGCSPPSTPESDSRLQGGSPSSTTLATEETSATVPELDLSKVKVTVAGKHLENGAVVSPGSPVVVSGLPDSAQAYLWGSSASEPATTLGGISPHPRDSDRLKSRPLPPKSTWTVTLTGPGDGSRTISFKVGRPEKIAKPYVYPSGGTYGVGMPITINFGHAINRKGLVEDALSVTTTRGIPAGSWSWTSDSVATFRPRTYWEPYTKVTVDAQLAGIEVSPGVWGKDHKSTFSIGREVIMRMDTDKFQLSFYRDGKNIRTIPVSGGKPGWETADGVKVVSEKHEIKRLYNPDPVEGWDVTVPWALRLTYSGEFIHSAPWNSQIGYANTSHGCTNMTTEDAKWVFERTIIGDVVETRGSGVKVQSWNGLGGLWNIPWREWASLSTSAPVERTPAQPASVSSTSPMSPMTFPG